MQRYGSWARRWGDHELANRSSWKGKEATKVSCTRKRLEEGLVGCLKLEEPSPLAWNKCSIFQGPNPWFPCRALYSCWYFLLPTLTMSRRQSSQSSVLSSSGLLNCRILRSSIPLIGAGSLRGPQVSAAASRCTWVAC
jgi:hypothetical protein